MAVGLFLESPDRDKAMSKDAESMTLDECIEIVTDMQSHGMASPGRVKRVVTKLLESDRKEQTEKYNDQGLGDFRMVYAHYLDDYQPQTQAEEKMQLGLRILYGVRAREAEKAATLKTVWKEWRDWQTDGYGNLNIYSETPDKFNSALADFFERQDK